MDVHKNMPGIAPDKSSPDYPAFAAMQVQCRSGLGACIWAMRAHTKLTLGTTLLCARMSNPSFKDNRDWKLLASWLGLV